MPGINGHNTDKTKQAENAEGQSGMTSTAKGVGSFLEDFWKHHSGVSVLGEYCGGDMMSFEEERLILGTKEIFSQLPCVCRQSQNPGAGLGKAWESSPQRQMETPRDDQMN